MMANKYYDTNTINDVIKTVRNPFLCFLHCLLLQFYVALLSRVSTQRRPSDRISEKKREKKIRIRKKCRKNIRKNFTAFAFPSLLSGSKATSKAAYAAAVHNGARSGHS